MCGTWAWRTGSHSSNPNACLGTGTLPISPIPSRGPKAWRGLFLMRGFQGELAAGGALSWATDQRSDFSAWRGGREEHSSKGTGRSEGWRAGRVSGCVLSLCSALVDRADLGAGYRAGAVMAWPQGASGSLVGEGRPPRELGAPGLCPSLGPVQMETRPLWSVESWGAAPREDGVVPKMDRPPQERGQVQARGPLRDSTFIRKSVTIKNQNHTVKLIKTDSKSPQITLISVTCDAQEEPLSRAGIVTP